MENQEQQKKSHNWIWWLIAIIAACTITGFLVHNNESKIDKFFSCVNNKELQEQETMHNDSVYAEDIEYTISDILEFRRHIRECNRIDSVYMNMPEVVLIDILMNYGTEMDPAEIVYIYESNPDTYNAVQSGARAQKYKEQFEPDSIPKKSDSDAPTPNVNCILKKI